MAVTREGGKGPKELCCSRLKLVNQPLTRKKQIKLPLTWYFYSSTCDDLPSSARNVKSTWLLTAVNKVPLNELLYLNHHTDIFTC